MPPQRRSSRQIRAPGVLLLTAPASPWCNGRSLGLRRPSWGVGVSACRSTTALCPAPWSCSDATSHCRPRLQKPPSSLLPAQGLGMLALGGVMSQATAGLGGIFHEALAQKAAKRQGERVPAVWGGVPAGDTGGLSRTPPGEVASTPRAPPGRCSYRREGRAAQLILTASVILTARPLSFPERKLCGKLFFLECAVA